MLRISVEKSDGKVLVTLNDAVIEMPVRDYDRLMPHGYIALLELICPVIEREIAPIQIGAYLHKVARMKSYKQAAALRDQLAAARRAAETVPHHYYGA